MAQIVLLKRRCFEGSIVGSLNTGDNEMGLFSGIKDTFKMSEAAVVVQNLLEHQAKCGLFDLSPAAYATELVGKVWQGKPDVFGGKFGQRPHKISTAAVALGFGYSRMREDDLNRNAVLLALGMLLAEVERNGNLYPLNSLDHQLLENVAKRFAEAVEKLEPELAAADSLLNGRS
ncbi:MAG TPA: hypothetical protein VFH71_10275 [Rhodanobacteraceae bacterium]|nr:hypothetical protein [Rhodanobacteraceae bacterium]